MPRNKFTKILTYLRFDDKPNRIRSGSAAEKFAPIRDVFNTFTSMCQINFQANQTNSEFTITMGKSSFLLVSDLSLVVSKFFSLVLLLELLTSTNWGVNSVSGMLTSCSSALDVPGQISDELIR